MDLLDKRNKAFERMDRISAITNKIANINEVATNPIEKVLEANERVTKLASVGDHIAHS